MLNDSHIQDAWDWERERKPPCQVNDSRFATLKTFWSKLGFFHCHSVPALLLANQAIRCVWCTPLMECWSTIAFHPFYSFARRRSLFLKLILKWCLTPFVYIKLLVRLHARQLTVGKKLHSRYIRENVERRLWKYSSKKVMKIYGYRVCSTDLRFYWGTFFDKSREKRLYLYHKISRYLHFFPSLFIISQSVCSQNIV